MGALIGLVAAWLIAAVINVFPAFMPPTWSILAIFKVTTDAPLLPLTIGGAAASAVGRTGLAFLSVRLGDKLPEKDRENAKALGDFLRRHGRWGIVLVFIGCLGPLPSNALFIAAGLGKVALKPLVIAFFLSRAIADTFWVWSAGKVSENVGGLFRDQITSWPSILIQVAGLILVVAVFRLPWAKWLGATEDDNRTSTKKPRSPAPAPN